MKKTLQDRLDAVDLGSFTGSIDPIEKSQIEIGELSNILRRIYCLYCESVARDVLLLNKLKAIKSRKNNKALEERARLVLGSIEERETTKILHRMLQDGCRLEFSLPTHIKLVHIRQGFKVVYRFQREKEKKIVVEIFEAMHPKPRK